MTALLILNYDVVDGDALTAYREAATPVLLGDGGGELVTSTGQTVPLAEATQAGTHTVVLRFGSVDEAVRAYESDRYRPLLAQRLQATKPRFAALVPVTAG